MELVIVESPSKAKTIEKYLGDNFKVLSSVGHIRDLDPNSFSLDDELNPIYKVMEGKESVVNQLKSAAARASKTYLMTDQDREGEAIAWHLREELGLKPGSYARCVFTEITPTAIKKALQSPRDIDMKMVKAQEARRVLDRIIGYTVSPIMSGIYQAPSTGRVQTVAAMLVVDRQLEINKFKRKPYFDIELVFKDKEQDWVAKLQLDSLIKSGKFKEEIVQFEGSEKYRLIHPGFATAIRKVLFDSQKVTVSTVRKTPKISNPKPPFITSTLLQFASSKLGWSAEKVGRVSQKLYESGLITYIRTDNPNLCDEAIEAVRAEILALQKKNPETLKKSLLAKTPNRFPIPDNAQEAHEAIRPTKMDVTASRISDQDGSALYDLIWRRTMACQMTPKEYDLNEIELRSNVQIKGEDFYFKASGQSTTFPGYEFIYSDLDPTKAEAILPILHDNDEIGFTRIEKHSKHTKPPPRFTEPTLLKEIEKRDISRPSTYVATVATILNRGYVIRKDKYLEASKLAMNYIANIREPFTFVDYEYTSLCENKFDKINHGTLTFEQFINAENFTLDNDINNFSQVHAEKLNGCKSCGNNTLIKHKAKKKIGRKESYYHKCFKCQCVYPDKDGKPHYDFEPPKLTEHVCPRCEQEKLKVFSKNSDTKQRWFGCNSPSCNTLLPSTANSWDSDNPIPDIDLWKSNHIHRCPKCSENGRNNYLLLSKRNPEAKQRYFFCEDEKCKTFVQSTADTWNTGKPQPDFKHYKTNHTFRCPACQKDYLKLSSKKTSWFCGRGPDRCKTFVKNVQDINLESVPDKGYLIYGESYGTYFCSNKCGVLIFKTEGGTEHPQPDLNEFANRKDCVLSGCKGQLVQTRDKSKFRCTDKDCDAIYRKNNIGEPDIEFFNANSLCPKCSNGVLIHSKQNGNFFCSSYCGAFVNESQGDSSLPDIAEFKRRPNCVVDGCSGHLVLTTKKDKFRCTEKGCDVLILNANGSPDFASYEKEIKSLKACPECKQVKLRLSKGSPEKKPQFYCTSKLCQSNRYPTLVPLGLDGEPDYNLYSTIKAERKAKYDQKK